VKDINVVGRKVARNGSKMFNLMTCKYKSTAWKVKKCQFEKVKTDGI
jgi:hypothetical protein